MTIHSDVEGAARLRGVVRRADAARQHSRSHVQAQLDARRWQCPVEGVLVTHNGPLTVEQQMWVSLLAGPPGSVLGGLSAAEHDGLKGFGADALTIVVPGSSRNCARRLQVAGDWPVRMSWSTMLGPEDVRRDTAPPRTRMPRSILDAASERVSPKRSRVLVLAAVQQGRTRPPALWDALSRRGRCRNRAVIAESIVDAGGGIQSLPEHEYDLLLRARHIPRPTRQRVVQRRDGRYFLDTDWADYGVRTEIHGIPHMRVENWDADLLRQNDITIAGGGLLIFSSYAIRHERARVTAQVEAMLRRHGWPG